MNFYQYDLKSAGLYAERELEFVIDGCLPKGLHYAGVSSPSQTFPLESVSRMQQERGRYRFASVPV